MERISLKNLPHSPGVYVFKDQNRNIIYIGKAIDLARRVSQYFQNIKSIDYKTLKLVENIKSIKYFKTLSEFDALLLEAKLINFYKPKYNILAKDDKSRLYIQITRENIPRIETLRLSQIDKSVKSDIFGPYESGSMARSLLSSIRKIAPFCLQKIRNGKPCFYTQIGLCDPCPSEFGFPKGNKLPKDLSLEYKKNIKKLKNILNGKIIKVRSQLQQEMLKLAESEDFEKAAQVRNQIYNLNLLLQKRIDPMTYFQNDQKISSEINQEINGLLRILQNKNMQLNSLARIECFDIANIAGEYATGSMVVMTNGIIDKSRYRRFKVKFTKIPNDTAMLAEIIKRRLRHREWPDPDLLIVDGGKGQIMSAVKAIEEANLKIAVAGLAKRYETIHLYIGQKIESLNLSPQSPELHLMQRIRDEAHRFARVYHHHLISKIYQ